MFQHAVDNIIVDLLCFVVYLIEGFEDDKLRVVSDAQEQGAECRCQCQ